MKTFNKNVMGVGFAVGRSVQRDYTKRKDSGMSKYYKAEDVINAIEDKIAEYIPTLYGRYGEIPLELRMAIEHLPTIEVSEDCISREWVLKAIDAEDVGTPDEMWRPAREYVEMIKNAPSVVPTTEQSSMVGEWIKQGQGRYRRCVCSVCGHGNGRKYNDNFCSNCGAKMKGADND